MLRLRDRDAEFVDEFEILLKRLNQQQDGSAIGKILSMCRGIDGFEEYLQSRANQSNSSDEVSNNSMSDEQNRNSIC